MSSKAKIFKDQGNEQFKAGDFKAAQDFYTQAIRHDSSNLLLFTNRANARLRLNAWEDAIDDCLSSIALDPTMKAYYYLAQAQLALRHPNEALSSALRAYEFCLDGGGGVGKGGAAGSTLTAISNLILTAKKEKWERRETDRLRRRGELVAELEERLIAARNLEVDAIRDREYAREIGPAEADEEIEIVEELSRRKVEEVKDAFAFSHPDSAPRREVPDYLVDSITFSIMHDPVVTKTGNSYDRATIIEHLRRSSTDPLTREPLRMEDLRPNLALRQACDEFLEKNGWAVDW